jgi:hypothetical protein
LPKATEAAIIARNSRGIGGMSAQTGSEGSRRLTGSASPAVAVNGGPEMIIVRRSLAKFLITYYWVIIFISLALYLYPAIRDKVRPDVIELSFYPLFFLVGGLTKFFLMEKVPGTFARLRASGSLEANAVQEATTRFANRMNHLIGDALGIVFAVAVLGFYYSIWPSSGNISIGDALVLGGVAIIDISLAYAGGLAIWIAGVTAWQFRQFGRTGVLKVRPFHPDGCAGLAGIGQLFFVLSSIFIVIGIFLSGWLLCGWLLGDGLYRGFDSAFRVFGPWFAGSLIVAVLVSIAVFFLPLRAIHYLMRGETANHAARLSTLARRITDLEESLYSPDSEPSPEEIESRLKQIESLRTVYLRQRGIPTWPADFETLGKFLSTQFLLWAGAISSLWGHWEKLFGSPK